VNDEALGTLSKYRRWRAKGSLSLPVAVGQDESAIRLPKGRAWPRTMVRRPWRHRQSRRQRRGARVSGRDGRALHLSTFSRPGHDARKSPASMA